MMKWCSDGMRKRHEELLWLPLDYKLVSSTTAVLQNPFPALSCINVLGSAAINVCKLPLTQAALLLNDY